MVGISMKHWRFITFIFFITFSLAGCLRPVSESARIPCNALLATPFREHISQPLDVEEAVQIIELQYGVESDDVVINEFSNINEWELVIEWPMYGLVITLFRKNGNLAQIYINPNQARIASGRIVECVGSKPEWYRAIYGPRMERPSLDYVFEMWSPAEGIVTQTRGNVRSTERLPVISPDTEITYLFIAQPGSLEDVLIRIGPPIVPFSISLNEGTVWENALQPRPWPGNWEDIKFVEGW